MHAGFWKFGAMLTWRCVVCAGHWTFEEVAAGPAPPEAPDATWVQAAFRLGRRRRRSPPSRGKAPSRTIIQAPGDANSLQLTLESHFDRSASE
jgi:hypothetical protein